MHKLLLTSEADFKSFESAYTGHQVYYGDVQSLLELPEKYPCVVVWQTENNDNGPSWLCGEYVYLDDFED